MPAINWRRRRLHEEGAEGKPKWREGAQADPSHHASMPSKEESAPSHGKHTEALHYCPYALGNCSAPRGHGGGATTGQWQQRLLSKCCAKTAQTRLACKMH